MEFLHQHLEAFGNRAAGHFLALDDALVRGVAAVDVVGLDGQHLLEGVRRAVGFERPHFHFPEALPAVLGLTTERLLGDQAVRASGAGVELVFHHVVQLHDVHDPHHDRAGNRLPGAAVVQDALAGARKLHLGALVVARGGVDHAEFPGAVQHFLLALVDLEALVLAGLEAFGGGDFQHFLDGGFRGGVEHGRLELLPGQARHFTQVRFQDLAQVHAAGHTQRVEHDVHGRAVFQVRHVFGAHDLGHDALVPVAVRDLIAHLKLTLLGHVHTYHFTHAGLEVHALVAAAEAHGLDDDAALTGHDAQGGVFHLTGLLTEDGAQQTFFGGRLGLALEAGLAHQDVAGLDFRAHAHDAVLVQVAQRGFAQARNVAGDLLRPQLGVAGVDLVFLDVDAGVEVLLNQRLVDADRVFEVEAVERHDGDGDVLAQRQSAHVAGGTVRDHLPGGDRVAHVHDGLLVQVGALVAAGKAHQFEGTHVALVQALLGRVLGQRDLNGAGVHVGHLAVHVADHAGAAVGHHAALHARAHGGAVGAHERHGLRLHVGTHERAVGVVVLQERDQAGVDADDLLGRHVHEIHFVGRVPQRIALAAGQHALVGEGVVVVQGAVRLRDGVAVLDVGGHVDHVVGDLAAFHAAVGRFDEAQAVHLAVAGQTGNQADVRAFGRLDRADAAVVRTVHVAHVETGAFAGQAARPQRGDTALVAQVGQGVGLVLELGKLRAPEELAHGRHDGAVVHEFGGGRGVGVAQQHALTHATRHAAHADAQLVGQQFAHGAHAAVAQVVDVVLGHGDVGHDAVLVHHRHGLHAALQRHQVTDGVHQAGVRELAVLELQQGALLAVHAQLGVHLEAAGVAQVVAAGVGQQAVQVLRGLVALGRVAGAQHREQAQQGLVGTHARALVLGEFHVRLELREQRLQAGVVVAQHAQQHRHGELALVDLHFQHARVELQFDPGAALGHGDNCAGVLLFDALVAAREVHAGAAVNLGNDHAVGPVDDEGTVLGHQGQVAQEHLVLFDQAAVLVDQLELGVHGGLVGQVLLTAFLGGVGRLTQAVFQVVQHQARGAALLGLVDGKDFFKGVFQPHVVTLVGGLVGLKERPEGVHLDLGEVGKRNDFLDLAEAFDTRFLTVETHVHLA